MGVEASRSNSFRPLDKWFCKVTKLLRHFGTEIFRLTTHNSRLTKALAFTLAETLIVMGIIGIVSALTLPNLNSSTGDKDRVARAKKIYQNIEDAYGRAVAVYGPYEDWFVNDADNTAKAKRTGERITEFMKVSKDCGMAANQGCFKTEPDNYPTCYKIITADGTSIAFQYGQIYYIDLDGPNKGGAIPGKDLFKGPMVYNSTKKSLELNCTDNSTAIANISKKGNSNQPMCGMSWMVWFDNADYLKTDAQGKCNNNANITLDGSTNISCK